MMRVHFAVHLVVCGGSPMLHGHPSYGHPFGPAENCSAAAKMSPESEYVNKHTYTPSFLYMCIHNCKYLYVYTHVYVYMGVYIYVHTYVSIVYVYFCTCMCICIYVDMFSFVFDCGFRHELAVFLSATPKR